MDNLGAIGGPLLAIALVALVGTRSAMLVSVIPGLLATLAILYAITRRPDRPNRSGGRSGSASGRSCTASSAAS